MENNNVVGTIEEVAKASGKSGIGRKLLIGGGVLVGLIAGGIWLSRKSKANLDDFDDDECFEEEDDTDDSEDGSDEE